MGNLVNRIQRDAQALASAMQSKQANRLYQGLLQFTGNDYPILQDDNLKEHVHKGYLFNPDLYSIVNLITNASKGIDWVLYEVKDQKKFRKYKSLPSEAKEYQLDKVWRLKEQSMEEVHDPNNQLYRLMERPNPLQGWGEFIENALGFKLITGNSFIHGVLLENGANAGLVNEMWVMPSQYTRIVADKGYQAIVKGYTLEIGSRKVKFSEDEVLHLKYWNPDYEADGAHLYGLSPLRAATRVVQQSNDAYTAQAALLKNSGAQGILSVDPEHMTAETASQLESSYYNKYAGPGKRGRIIIAGAKMDWKQIGMSPVDLNILESQKFSLRDLCNIYNVNSALLNDPDNKVYNNVREARRALYMEKVLPELDTMRDEFNRWLVSKYNEKTGKTYYLDYDLESVPALQADMKLIMEQVKDAWWLTGNERRVAMGYDSDPVMDQYFIPAGLIPTGSMNTEDLDKSIAEYGVKQTFNDYPKSASDRAKAAIQFTEENPNDCATQVGKVRAQQLANRESISYDTVKRTFSFLSRAKEYDTGSFTDTEGNPVCGSISYAYWGGDSMRRWAEQKIKEIENA